MAAWWNRIMRLASVCLERRACRLRRYDEEDSDESSGEESLGSDESSGMELFGFLVLPLPTTQMFACLRSYSAEARGALK